MSPDKRAGGTEYCAARTHWVLVTPTARVYYTHTRAQDSLNPISVSPSQVSPTGLTDFQDSLIFRTHSTQYKMNDHDTEWLAALVAGSVKLSARPGVAVAELRGFTDAMRLCRVLGVRGEQEMDALLSPGHCHLVNHHVVSSDVFGHVVGLLARDKPAPQECHGWVFLITGAPDSQSVVNAVALDVYDSFERMLHAEGGTLLEPEQN